MRFHLTALLGIFILLLSTFGTGDEGAWAQADQITVSRNKLIEAFQAVQAADLQGASQVDIARLANQLNKALFYIENANGSNSYANMSATLSSQITGSALVLQNRALSQVLLAQAWAYSIAIVTSLFSTLLLMEAHRIRDFLQKRRFFKLPLR